MVHAKPSRHFIYRRTITLSTTFKKREGNFEVLPSEIKFNLTGEQNETNTQRGIPGADQTHSE